MSSEPRGITAADWEPWYQALDWAFGGIAESTEERRLWRGLVALDRCLGIYDEGQVVGTYGEFALGLTVPGGAVLEAGGVTMVSVAGTHRRRGLLRRMMARGLAAARERGDVLSVLTAAEPGIYGRFGYGVAARSLSAELDKRQVGLVNLPPGTDEVRLRVTTPAEALPACEAVYAELAGRRPGMLERRPGWERLGLLDPPAERGGASERRCVLAERDGRVVGYARYASRVEWRATVPGGPVLVKDLDATEPAGYAALLRYLLDLDLTDRVRLAGRPVDDPLTQWVSDVRRADLTLRDRLYLRPVELGGALAGRRYATEVDVVLAVTDDFCPWNSGRWRLTGGPAGAVCERTTDPAELTLDVRVLSTAYLGDATLGALAAAGLVGEERAGALAAASVAFGHPLAPWLPHGF
ncbi:GNAT family N-acetyltransferase [Streptomyces sp. DSM 44915]|uniref:GNAT family N-acetyltransferase n=1 Tax=Streptomyces chisholmiae TaxID=3075540 RepID=A0ABU2JW13_9ACTN|nr:GNAT family N-acetyltransferase [Streptomyces sp. DSM 44915]MDT0269191.1 GNAT family N-acetyltransferase [Streptomyces sp. DSM 44915]